MSRLARRLRWLIVVRLALTVSAAIPYGFVQLSAGGNLGNPAVYGLAGLSLAACVLHGLVAWTLPRRARFQAGVQLGTDLAIVTGMVWYFGGVHSPAVILYLAVIALGSALLGHRGGLLVATASFGLYTASLVALASGWSPPLAVPHDEVVPPWRLAYNLVIPSIGFFAVAFLTAHLAEERQLKEDLADLEMVHRDIIESIPSGLMTTDLGGTITRVNRAGCDILGLGEAAMTGRPIHGLGLLSAERWRRLTSTSADEDTGDRDEVDYRRDGEVRCIGFSVSTLRQADGAPTGHIFIFQDLTGWRRLQEEVRLKDRMAAVGELAAGIAHEIGNPLAAISGSVQMLSSSVEGSSPEQKLLDILHKESQRLDRTIKGFLRFARPRERANTRFDVAALLRESLELLANSPEVSERHVVEVDLDPPAVEMLGDPDQISQIFWNLSRNALRAMPDGGTLRVSGRRHDGSYRIEFQDTGRGMSAEERANLFHPFQSFFDEGTGIGMAIVYRIVQGHGGRLAVESRPAEGTTISVELPLAGALDAAGGDADGVGPADADAELPRGGRDVSESAHILVVDDEQSILDFLRLLFEREGYEVATASSMAEARRAIAENDYELLVCDIIMPDGNGLDLLREVKRSDPAVSIIMMTAYTSTRSAIEAMKLGAYDYISKPFDVEELKVVVQKALEKAELVDENLYLKSALEERYTFNNIVGKSPRMQAIFALIERVARTSSTILVHGESGTGKELIARAIHFSSPRSGHRFLSINCGAMPDNLLESELFGHERGAFTGAVKEKKGLFQEADEGTLFLDEIGEMSPGMQVKLLRVLQEKTVRKVGGNREEPVDVRIIAATNLDLEAAIGEGEFREDLYYRINVIPIHLPPLRRRREDIPLLVDFFLRKYAEEMEVDPKRISVEAMQALERYTWPGNVRELENVIERALALCQGDAITVDDLTADVLERTRPVGDPLHLPEDGLDLEEHLSRIRRQLMEQALERADGVQKRAAELLGMSFRSFRYYGKKLGVTGTEEEVGVEEPAG